MPICTCPVSDERFDVPIWVQIREIAIATVETNLVIVEGKTILREIPRRLEGLNIVDGAVTLTEIRDPYQVLGDLEYRVDYNVGWIYFNNTYYADGVSIDTIEYTGRGVLLYPYERIIRGDGTLLTDGINSVLENGVLVSDKIGKFDFRQNIQVYVDPLDEHSIIINVDPNAGFGGAFLDLSDAPSTYVGQSLKLTRVNVGQTGIEFVDVASIPEIADHEDRITVIEDDINIPTSEESVPYNKAQGQYALSKDALAVAIHGINVLPVKNYYGRDLTWLVENPDYRDGTNGYTTGSSSLSVVNSDLLITGTGSGASPETLKNDGYPTSNGVKIYLQARMRVTNALAEDISLNLRRDSGSFIGTAEQVLTPNINEWYLLNGIVEDTTGADNSYTIQIRHLYADAGTASGKVLEVDYVIAIPLPSDITTVAEMEALLDGKIQDKGNSWVGKPVELDQLQDNRNEFGNFTLNASVTVDKETSQDAIPYLKYTDDGVATVDTFVDIVWKPNTLYTALIHILENTSDIGFTAVFASSTDGDQVLTPAGEKGLFKITFNTGATPLTTLRSFLLSTAVTGTFVTVRQTIIEGDYTHLTDDEALRIIKEQEFGTFEVKGTWITSVEKNKINYLDYVSSSKWMDLTNIKNEIYTSDGSRAIDEYGEITLQNGTYKISNLLVDAATYRIQLQNKLTGITVVDSGNVSVEYEFTLSDDTTDYYIKIISPDDTIIKDVMIRLSSADSTYEEFIESIVHIDGELHDLPNGVYDDLDNQRTKGEHILQSGEITSLITTATNIDYVVIPRTPLVGIYTQVAGVNTGKIIFAGFNIAQTTNLDVAGGIYLIHDTSSVSGAILLTFEKGKYANLAAAQADLTGTFVNYELETYLPRTEANNNEIPVDGKLLVSVDGTYTQVSSGGVIDYFTTTVPLNLYGQLLLNILTDLSQQKEINWNKNEIEKLITDTQNLIDAVGYIPDLDTTATDLVEAINEVLADLIIAESDISDNVTAIGFNTTHRSSDGSDHSDVVLNTTHRTSNGLSHSQVATSKTITDFITITEAFNADKAAEYTELMAAKVDVSNATSIPASNVTTTSSIDDYDAIDIVLQFGDKIITKRVTIATNTDEIIIGFNNGLTGTTDGAIKFKFYRNSSTTFTAYYGRTISYGVYLNSSIATIDILKIYGVKFT